MRIRIYHSILLGLLLIGGVGFTFQQSTGVSPDSYLDAFRKNKETFRKSVDAAEFKYTITHIPSEVRYIHLWKNELADTETLENYLKENKGYLEFNVEIEVADFGDAFLHYSNDSTSYDDRLQYYAFDMEQDIVLHVDDKDVACTEYVFERDFGVSNKARIKLGFEVGKFKELELEINNRYAENKSATVRYSKKALRCLPRLKKLK